MSIDLANETENRLLKSGKDIFFKNGVTVVQLFRKVEEELGEEIVCILKT